MQVLRAQASGLTASFRYPHFLVGRQPSFRMPPPATIYGLICCALGEFIQPGGLRFAYVFTHQGVADDVELLHVIEAGTGRLPGGTLPKNLEATTNPVRREVLLFPEITLYVSSERGEADLDRLAHAFREPRYTAVLGRSQDLLSYRSVEIVDLEESAAAYFQSTLLPWSYYLRTLAGIAVTMPRFIDPADRRRVLWSPFVVLEDRVRLTDEVGAEPPGPTVLARASADERVWVDPTAPRFRGLPRAVVWHDFLGEGEGEFHPFRAPATPLG